MPGIVTPINPESVKFILHGRRLTHFPKGTYLNAEPQGEGIQIAKGLLDSSSVIIDPDSSANITVTLMQEKFDNQFLSDLHLQQKRGIIGSLNLLVKIIGGTTLIESNTAFVQNFAGQQFSQEAENREWVIACASCAVFNVGGSTPV